MIHALALALVAQAGTTQDPEAARPAARFYRGNTHTHTLWSDGDGAPELVADWYRRHGYHFLVLSDHNVLSEGERWFPISEDKGSRLTAARVAELRERFGPDAVETRERDGKMEMRLRTLAELRERFEQPGEFLFVQGEEVTASYTPTAPGARKLPVHVNALNVAARIDPLGGDSPLEVLNSNIDAIVGHGRTAGRPVLAHVNHPNFGWALTWRDVAAIRGDRFFEVYNGHRSVHNHGDAERDSTEAIWDRALTLRLAELGTGLLYGIASDDTHHYHEPDATAVPGRGWIEVRAEALSADAIIDAMRRGDFYATTGVIVEDWSTQAGRYRIALQARGDETLTVRFFGTRRTADGVGAPGELLLETRENPADYRFQGDELYVRAVVTSSRAQADPAEPGDLERAWLQPVLPSTPLPAPPITVMTFNLRFASDRPPHSWPERREACIATIRATNPDLLGTQEGLRAQLDDLKQALPGYTLLGQGRRGGDQDEHCAILIRTERFECLESGDFWLSETPDVPGSLSFDADLPRMVTWARLRDRLTGQQFHAVNTHFDHAHPWSRQRSAELLLHWNRTREESAAGHARLPMIVTGDFNAPALTDPVYEALVTDGPFTDLFTTAREPGHEVGTFHGFRGGDSGRGRIDWILARGSITAQSSTIPIDPIDGVYPSDHYPVVVTLLLDP